MDPDKPNKPGDSAFKQQKLKSWDLSLSKWTLALAYVLIGLFFILIGTLIVVESNKVIEHKLRYDDIDACKADWKSPRTCTIKLKLHEKMNSPIFIYYEISNMYQNHRKYDKSRDIEQLMGTTRSKNDIDANCDPIKTMDDVGLSRLTPSLSPKSVANPCGLIAKSVFNDTYSISPLDSTQKSLDISFKDISWSVDREDKFKRNDNKKLQWIDVEDGN